MGKTIELLPFLQKIVAENTHSYQSDFAYDRETLVRAAREPNMEDRVFYWMSRPAGTWCVREREAFLLESEAHTIWTYHEAEAEHIRAYRVTVTGLRDGAPVGMAHPLDYKTQVRRVKQAALPVDTVEVCFPGSPAMTLPYREWAGHRGRLIDQYGAPERVRYAPASEAELAGILQAERMMPAAQKRPSRKKKPATR